MFLLFFTKQGVRDSLALAQNELACSKANPSDSMGRGNSLFAEVEDKRQAVQQKISSLSSKYKEMKKDYSSKCSEISKLKVMTLPSAHTLNPWIIMFGQSNHNCSVMYSIFVSLPTRWKTCNYDENGKRRRRNGIREIFGLVIIMR